MGSNRPPLILEMLIHRRINRKKSMRLFCMWDEGSFGDVSTEAFTLSVEPKRHERSLIA